MKKLLLAFTFACNAIAMTTLASAQVPTNAYTTPNEWMKSKTQSWPGMVDGKTYWYKIDNMAKLWWSMDGKKWAAVDSGNWMDKSGKWIKINDGKIVWSSDGQTWSDVPEWKWEGSDGKWYKFDKDWTLWVN